VKIVSLVIIEGLFSYL